MSLRPKCARACERGSASIGGRTCAGRPALYLWSAPLRGLPRQAGEQQDGAGALSRRRALNCARSWASEGALLTGRHDGALQAQNSHQEEAAQQHVLVSVDVISDDSGHAP
eukprot:scaffold121_cov412-Prasinococcus_capsulatus_cf.AAC.9